MSVVLPVSWCKHDTCLGLCWIRLDTLRAVRSVLVQAVHTHGAVLHLTGVGMQTAGNN